LKGINDEFYEEVSLRDSMNNQLQELMQKWHLRDLRSFTHIALPNNYVRVGYSDLYQQEVVLKIGSKKIIDSEIKALQYFQGDACVQLLQYDQSFLQDSALLLEYVRPGNSLKELFLQGKEKESIEIFANLIKKLHTKEYLYQQGDTVVTIADRLQFLKTFRSNNDQLVKLLPQAIALADRLLATQGKQYFLHGDLHHENILQSDDTWVMIDPQGFIGELEYEIGAFIRNPLFELLDHRDLHQLMIDRFNQLSLLLDVDKKRIIDWSFVQSVLAACYCQQNESKQGENYFIAVAELIAYHKENLHA